MKGKILSFVLILSAALFAALICGGAALADDGAGTGQGMDWKLIVIPILAFLWSIYYPALRKVWADIWTTNDNFWWKARASLIAIFTALWPCLIEVWKGYGGIIVSLIVQLIRARFNIPAMYRAASAHPRAPARKLDKQAFKKEK